MVFPQDHLTLPLPPPIKELLNNVEDCFPNIYPICSSSSVCDGVSDTTYYAKYTTVSLSLPRKVTHQNPMIFSYFAREETNIEVGKKCPGKVTLQSRAQVSLSHARTHV